jgi:hypothetical protein
MTTIKDSNIKTKGAVMKKQLLKNEVAAILPSIDKPKDANFS